MVELLGIKELECVRKLLQGFVNLEFWEIFDVKEIVFYFFFVDNRLCDIFVVESGVVFVDFVVIDIVVVVQVFVIFVVDSFVVVLKGEMVSNFVVMEQMKKEYLLVFVF